VRFKTTKTTPGISVRYCRLKPAQNVCVHSIQMLLPRAQAWKGPGANIAQEHYSSAELLFGVWEGSNIFKNDSTVASSPSHLHHLSTSTSPLAASDECRSKLLLIRYTFATNNFYNELLTALYICERIAPSF
jgi:hypothetical protein